MKHMTETYCLVDMDGEWWFSLDGEWFIFAEGSFPEVLSLAYVMDRYGLIEEWDE